MPRPAVVAVAALFALLTTACGDIITVTREGGSGLPALTEAPASAAGEQLRLTQRCRNKVMRVRYPKGWTTNKGGSAMRCSYFDPETFDVSSDAQAPALAISFSDEPVRLRQLRRPRNGERILSNRRLKVDGHPAIRRETIATGDALLPKGVRTTFYAIRLGKQRTLVASTSTLGGQRYERNVRVLDRMIRRLRLRR